MADIARSGIRKISIFKDKYLENRFIYKSFEAIFVRRNEKNLFTTGNREIWGKFALNVIMFMNFVA